MKYIGRKTPFPPLGLLTFAALMPQDEWDFELVDLNVDTPSNHQLHQQIQAADVVFTGAMNIQRQSLVDLLAGPAKGTDTPWVLGGPMASTYRDTVLTPQTENDQILHDGLDFLMWGEAHPWIDQLCQTLKQTSKHSNDTPYLFIPERVLREPSGSRKYLRDKEIFKPLDNVPIPRWDLVNPDNYRSMMLQTTAGCRFRCTFCDIVQFNGGFARAKDKAAVTRELQAIYDTGFRGGVFTVDDNFVSEPDAMEFILEGMTEFQREHNYPFSFFTQASIDLGKEELSHLLPMMQQAGFQAVFLGIENPDPAALRQMNKIQNIKTSPKDTVHLLQRYGIEVYAGFIFGTDTDTLQTADLIVDFVKGNGILSAMTGKLTPMPHTPLYMDLKAEGRLLADGQASNNVDDTLQYEPIMGPENLKDGFQHILTTLFNRKAVYERCRSVMERVDYHIFAGSHVGSSEIKAAVRSLFNQGLRGRNGFFDIDYFRLLKGAFQMNRVKKREVQQELKEITSLWQNLTASTSNNIELDADNHKRFEDMINYANEALVRYHPQQKLKEVQDFIRETRASLEQGVITKENAQTVYNGAQDYLNGKIKMFSGAGLYPVKAIQLALMGTHYRQVVGNILESGNEEGFVSAV